MGDRFVELELSAEQFNYIAEASNRARNAPVMLVGNIDLSQAAYDDLRRCWEKVANDLGVEVDTIAPISSLGLRWIRARRKES